MRINDTRPGMEGTEMDLVEDFRRFREIVRDRVEFRLQNEPPEMHNHWVMACYRSMKTFAAEFPNPQQRTAVLRSLEESAKRTRLAVKRAAVLIDEFEGDSESCDDDFLHDRSETN